MYASLYAQCLYVHVLLCAYNVCTVWHAMTETLKDTRWNLRVATSENALVRQAASTVHQNLSEFVIDAAVGEAERVLADRTRFVLDEAQWNEFVDLLERPVHDNPGLVKLFAKPSVFE